MKSALTVNVDSSREMSEGGKEEMTKVLKLGGCNMNTGFLRGENIEKNPSTGTRTPPQVQLILEVMTGNWSSCF